MSELGEAGDAVGDVVIVGEAVPLPVVAPRVHAWVPPVRQRITGAPRAPVEPSPPVSTCPQPRDTRGVVVEPLACHHRGMEIPSHVRELQLLWQEEYGETLNDGEAIIMADRLLRFGGLLASTLAELSTENELDLSGH